MCIQSVFNLLFHLFRFGPEILNPNEIDQRMFAWDMKNNIDRYMNFAQAADFLKK